MSSLGPQGQRTRIWAAPAAIGAAVAAGLAAALLVDGPLGQAAVCVALALPVAVAISLAVRR